MMENDNMNEEEKLLGRLKGEQLPADPESLGMRLLHLFLISMMVGVAVQILGIVALVQFVIMLMNKGEANPSLAEFGEDLGIWMAKAARYIAAASRVKPWPWTEID